MRFEFNLKSSNDVRSFKTYFKMSKIKVALTCLKYYSNIIKDRSCHAPNLKHRNINMKFTQYPYVYIPSSLH